MNIKYKNTNVKISPKVYEPSEDSFLLAETALSEIGCSERILEVGCGTGIISAVIKANTRAIVVGIDINPHAAKCTKENGVEVIIGDLLNCIKGRFDIILFNPPYLPTGKRERTKDWINAALDGGPDGRKVIKRFLKQAGDCLNETGRIMLLVSSLTGIEEVKSIMASCGFAAEERVQEGFMFERLEVIVATKMRSPI